MPNIQSAVKRMRQAQQANLRNRMAKAEIATTRRNILAMPETRDIEAGRKVFQRYCSVLDKAAKRGMIKKNTAVRRKRRAARRLALTSAAAGPAASS